jgi:hypothetical protein
LLRFQADVPAFKHHAEASHALLNALLQLSLKVVFVASTSRTATKSENTPDISRSLERSKVAPESG